MNSSTVNTGFYKVSLKSNITVETVGFRIENLESAWESSYGVDPTGGDSWGEPVQIEYECWLGTENQRSDSKVSGGSISYSGGQVDLGTSLSYSSGVDNSTYSCMYGFKQKVDETRYPDDQVFNGYLYEGVNNRDGNINVNTGTELIEAPTGIETSTSTISWDKYPTGECVSTRNPEQGLNDC